MKVLENGNIVFMVIIQTYSCVHNHYFEGCGGEEEGPVDKLVCVQDSRSSGHDVL